MNHEEGDVCLACGKKLEKSKKTALYYCLRCAKKKEKKINYPRKRNPRF